MRYINKNFLVEGVKVKNLVKKFNTPIYCYSYKRLKTNIDNFKKLEYLFKTENLFLNKNLSLDMICNRIGLKQKIITAIIKENTSNNWKSYLNGYRVDYAIELIKADFLVKYSVFLLCLKLVCQ